MEFPTTWKGILALIIAIVVMVGISVGALTENDGPTAGVAFNEIGLLEEHPVEKLISFTRLTGTVHGCYFVGSGSTTGELNTAPFIEFRWKDRAGAIITTTLPKDLVVEVEDETKQSPTVKFIFDQEWLQFRHIGIRYADTHPNEHIKSGNLQRVEVRISKTARQKEPAL